MTGTTRPRSGPLKRTLGAAVAVGLVATGFVATSQVAGAEPQTVASGGLDWGVKESFRGYVTSPIAHGSVTLGDGATQNPDGTFHFPADTSAEFDADAGAPVAAFDGSVHFVGHDGLLDIEISEIRVRYDGADSGVLVADVVSVPFEGTEPPIPPSTTYDDVELASLSGGTWSTAGTNAAWSAAASSLTSAGEPAFGGFYPAGTAFDPVSFSLTLDEADPDPDPDPIDAGAVWKLSQHAWTSSSLSPAHEAGAPAVLGTDGWELPAAATSYDPASGATTLDLDGSMTLGNVNQGGYRIQLAEPSIVVDQYGGGVLQADVSYCTGAAGSQPCASGLSTPERVVVVTFTLPDGTVTDTGTEVSWTVTPDYPLQGDPANPTRGQFPQSFLDALDPSLRSHFRDSGSGSDVNKPPAPLAVSFDYTAATPAAGVVQHITTEVEAGGLTISVDDDTVVLPSPTLAADGTALVTSGEINPVTVVDLRAGDVGWNAQGQVGDFSGSAGTIAGTGLGWTPAVVSQADGQTVDAGATVVAGAGDGLTAPSVLGSSPAGASRGTAVFGAGLELRAPTDTAPGTYTALLTLTVI